MDDFYDDLSALERALNFPEGSLNSIPIYARKPAVDAILKVKKMEETNLFRPGLYYIVLADLCANTSFNKKYGNAEADLRTQWFHTAAISALGEIKHRNYATFIKTIGDANLFIFSAFEDVFNWSEKLSKNLSSLDDEYPDAMTPAEDSDDKIQEQLNDFKLNARRLVHLGEVAYNGSNDPLCLAVNEIFKIEKIFSKTDLGCTQVVANAVKPKLAELKLELAQNEKTTVSGDDAESMTYYILKR